MRASKLADPNSRHVKQALLRSCPLCGAQPHQRCVITTALDGQGRPRTPQQLTGRIVHIARVNIRDQP